MRGQRLNWGISIHALLAESDNTVQIVVVIMHAFLSTLSLRRATQHTWPGYHVAKYFYPRSPCGERHETTPNRVVETQISIHALLAESDFRQNYECFMWIKFLSTLSLRRATQCKLKLSKCTPYFYPRSPCGERRLPTALRTPHHIFLSTLSLRRAT